MQLRRPTAAGIALAILASAASAAAQSRAVSLEARPTSLGPTQNVLLSGGVSSGSNGESLTLQAKPCGSSTFATFSSSEQAPAGDGSASTRPE